MSATLRAVVLKSIINHMKNKSLTALFALATPFIFAQNITIGNDKMPLAKFEKEYQQGLESQGVSKTIESYINFKVAQNFAKEQKADTLQFFRNNVNKRLNELKKEAYYPENLEKQFLNDYLSASQKEYQVQIFFAKKDASKKVDYKKIYDDVQKGSISIDQAIKDYTEGSAKAIFVKAGTMDYELDKEVQKLPIGSYSKIVNTPEYVSFVKKTGERPSLGYLILGTISYPNDEKANAKKDSIYTELNKKTPFEQVAAKFGSNENETKNGGAIMGSPILPDDVYAQMKNLKEGEYIKTPVLLENTWYIFNLYSKRPYKADTAEMKQFFFADMMNSQYGSPFFQAFFDQLKKNPSYKETPAYAKAKISYTEFLKLKDQDVLFAYQGENFKVSDFKNDIKDHTDKVAKMDKAQWDNFVNMMNTSFLMRIYNTEFENNPEIQEKLDEVKRNLYSNYFYTEYITKEVEKHPEWKKEYFNKNKGKYIKEAVARGRVIIPNNEDDVKKFTKAIKNIGDWEALKKQYIDGKIAKFNEGDMVESAEVFQKYNVPFRTGVFTTKIGGRTLIIANDLIIPSGEMTQQEALELGTLEEDVTADFIQKTLEEQKQKTKIEIDPGFISALEKKFKK